MKTILVTGGTGFIGNCFCKLLLNERPEYRVINVDVCTYAANPSTMKEELKNKNYKFYKTDIRDREAVYKIFEEEKPNIVVNFAAESHVDRSIIDPESFLTTNIIGTEVLMDACRKYGIERYHQVSTDEVYGDLPLDRQIYSSMKILHYIHLRHIAHLKHLRIYSCSLIIVHMVCR